MSEQINHGGSAFPVTYEGFEPHEGMTLRDYFAAKALQGMLSDVPKPLWGLDWKANVSKASYELADEMLKASAK